MAGALLEGRPLVGGPVDPVPGAVEVLEVGALLDDAGGAVVPGAEMLVGIVVAAVVAGAVAAVVEAPTIGSRPGVAAVEARAVPGVLLPIPENRDDVGAALVGFPKRLLAGVVDAGVVVLVVVGCGFDDGRLVVPENKEGALLVVVAVGNRGVALLVVVVPENRGVALLVVVGVPNSPPG